MNRREILIPSAIFAGTLILWGIFAGGELYIGDSAELLGASANLGIAHPPGYPVFTILTHTILGLGRFIGVPFALSANLFALLAAGAGAVLLWLALREFGVSRIPALIGAAVWIGGPLITGQALTFEVHALQQLLLGALLLAVARGAGDREDGSRNGLILAFLTGLVLTNHYSGAALLPLALWCLWKSRPEKGGNRALWAGMAAAALLIPLSAYLYLPIRAGVDPSYDYGMVGNLPNLWAHLTGKSYAYSFVEGGRFATGLPAAGGILFDSVPWPLWALVPLGLVAMFKRNKALAVAGLLTPFITVVVLLFYRIVDPLDYLSPVVMIVAVWIAFGAEWLRQRLTERKRLGAVLTGAALTLVIGWWFFSAMDADRERTGRLTRWGAEDFLRELLPGSLYFGEGDDAFFGPLALASVEDLRPDALVIDELGNLNRGPLGPVYPTLYGQVRKEAQYNFARRWAEGGGAVQLTLNNISPRLGTGIQEPLGQTLRLRYPDTPTLDKLNRPLTWGEPWRYKRVTGFSGLHELDTDDEYLRNGQGFPARLRSLVADQFICRAVALTDPLSPLGPELLERGIQSAPESIVSLGKIAQAGYRGAVWGLCALEIGASAAVIREALPRWFRPDEEALPFTERLPDGPPSDVVRQYLAIGAEAAEAMNRIRPSPESAYLASLFAYSRGEYAKALDYLDGIRPTSDKLATFIEVLAGEIELRLETGGTRPD